MSNPTMMNFDLVTALPTQSIRRLARCLGLVVVLLVISGCGPGVEELAPADAQYDARGTIRRLGDQQGEFREVVVRHESIAEFRNRDGETVGMDSMAMPFAVLDGIVLKGLEVGDAVAIGFDVRWTSDPVLLITTLELLPDGTQLDFSPSPTEPEATPDSHSEE